MRWTSNETLIAVGYQQPQTLFRNSITDSISIFRSDHSPTPSTFLLTGAVDTDNLPGRMVLDLILIRHLFLLHSGFIWNIWWTLGQRCRRWRESIFQVPMCEDPKFISSLYVFVRHSLSITFTFTDQNPDTYFDIKKEGKVRAIYYLFSSIGQLFIIILLLHNYCDLLIIVQTSYIKSILILYNTQISQP